MVVTGDIGFKRLICVVARLSKPVFCHALHSCMLLVKVAVS
jgi:hypothetical protein